MPGSRPHSALLAAAASLALAACGTDVSYDEDFESYAFDAQPKARLSPGPPRGDVTDLSGEARVRRFGRSGTDKGAALEGEERDPGAYVATPSGAGSYHHYRFRVRPASWNPAAGAPLHVSVGNPVPDPHAALRLESGDVMAADGGGETPVPDLSFGPDDELLIALELRFAAGTYDVSVINLDDDERGQLSGLSMPEPSRDGGGAPRLHFETRERPRLQSNDWFVDDVRVESR